MESSSSFKTILKNNAKSPIIFKLAKISNTNNKYLKFIWIGFFLMSFSLCLHQIYLSISEYFKYEVVTKITLNYETNVEFPMITICNSNPFISNYSNEFVNNFLKESNIDLSGFNPLFYDPINKKEYKQSQKIFLLKYLLSTNAYNQSDEFKKKLGLTLDDMLISCTFNLEPCYKEEFLWYYDLFYGNCFKFNSGFNSDHEAIQTKTINTAGKINGFIIELFVGEIQNILGLNSGMHVFINNKSIPIKLFDGVDVSTGTETHIVIKRSFINKIEQPYSDCLKDLSSYELFQLIKKANSTYRRKDCLFICFQKYLSENCGCYNSNFMKAYNERPCLNSTEILCGFNSMNKIFTGEKADEIKSCLNKCPQECDSVIYSLTPFFSNYPTEAYANILFKNTNIKEKFNKKSEATFQKLKNSILALHVYYDDLYYTQIDEIKKIKFIELLSNIGGTLGLFIGMSFISILEFLEVFIESLYSYYENRKKLHNTSVKTTV